MERDPSYHFQFLQIFQISTHTLTWSVTSSSMWSRQTFDISTHTLTWSVTRPTYFPFYHHYNFNSHAHVERDDVFARNARHPIISTHTLTWSVTKLFEMHSHIFRFQLTRSRGAWLLCKRFNKWTVEFQLTRSRGAWQALEKINKMFGTFQLTRSRGAWHFMQAV